MRWAPARTTTDLLRIHHPLDKERILRCGKAECSCSLLHSQGIPQTLKTCHSKISLCIKILFCVFTSCLTIALQHLKYLLGLHDIGHDFWTHTITKIRDANALIQVLPAPFQTKVLWMPSVSQNQTCMCFLIPCIVAFKVTTATAVDASCKELNGARGSIHNGRHAVRGTILCSVNKAMNKKERFKNSKEREN